MGILTDALEARQRPICEKCNGPCLGHSIDVRIDRLHGSGAAAALDEAITDGTIPTSDEVPGADDCPPAPLERLVIPFQVERDEDGDFVVESELFPEIYVCEETLPEALESAARKIRAIGEVLAIAEIDRRIKAGGA